MSVMSVVPPAQLPQMPERTSRPASVWDYVSASRLNLWLKCPLAFKLRYIDRITTPPSANLFLGKRAHHGLEIHYRHRQLRAPLEAADVVHRMNEAWEAAVDEEGITFASVTEEEALRSKACDLVRAYLQQVPGDEPVPRLVETTLETPLIDPATGEDLGIPLLGILDLVLDGEEGPRIADRKTSARSGAPLEICHEIQLTAYAYLLRSISAERESGLEIRSLVKTKTPQIAVHEFAPRTDAHFRRFFAVIRGYLDDLHAGRFVYRPGFGCSMCDFRERCCAAV